MIEVLALISITLAIFRFKIMDYLWQSLLIAIVMNISSYVLRDDAYLSSFAPTSNIIFLALLAAIFLRVPLVWSFIMSLGGMIAYVIIQAIIMVLSLGHLSINAVDTSPEKGYMLQIITGVIVFLLSHLLYKFGIGYAADFERFKFKWEKIVVVTMIVLITCSLGVLLYYKEIIIDILFLVLALLFFFFYTTKKEVENNDSKVSSNSSTSN